MYEYELSTLLDKKLVKIAKKNKVLFAQIDKKIQLVLANPYHFKPLHGDKKNSRRVHVASSFVLTYDICENRKYIQFLNFDHHDYIYD